MRVIKRKPVNKYRSANKFRKSTRKVKGANMINRGGIRL